MIIVDSDGHGLWWFLVSEIKMTRLMSSLTQKVRMKLGTFSLSPGSTGCHWHLNISVWVNITSMGWDKHVLDLPEIILCIMIVNDSYNTCNYFSFFCQNLFLTKHNKIPIATRTFLCCLVTTKTLQKFCFVLSLWM